MYIYLHYIKLERNIKLINQSIPFRFIRLPKESVTVTLISDIIYFVIGLKRVLLGSNEKGKIESNCQLE